MEDQKKMSCKLNRREFLEKSLLSAAGVALSTSVVASFITACGKAAATTATPAVSIPNNGSDIYSFNFSDYSGLANAGGSIHVSVAASGGTRDLFITRVSSSSAIAVATLCTHQDCTLNAYDSTNSQYSCPCHGSVFSANGAVVNGPATRALTSYPGTVSASALQFTIT